MNRPDRHLPDLTGTVALVTGASGGIGAGIAARFAAAGAAVVLHYRTGRDAAEQTAAAITSAVTSADGAATAIGAEFGDPNQCRELIERAVAWGGRLDAVVHTAGIQPVQPLPEITAASWREVLDVNLTSALTLTQTAAEAMAPNGGSITYIASIEGTHPAPGHAHYAASKAALIMFARSAALEYGRQGIRVNTVSPGLIDRPGLAEAWPDGVERWHAAAPLHRLGRPEDVGDACVFLASPLASWITGHDLAVDGGVSARPTW